MFRRTILSLFLLLGLAAFVTANDHAPFGMPSEPAKKFADNKQDFLIEKDQFILSYNDKIGTPNWVAWRLTEGHLGKAKRSDRFAPDPELPKESQILPKSYKFAETAMTRGHMCPRSDRTATQKDANATFVMTNMVPQTEELNAGAWNDLEIYCREIAKNEDKELFIVSGPAGKGGRSKKGFFNTIADSKVTVPAHCWKVILVIDAGKDSLEDRVKEGVRVIAVIMPNDQTPTGRTPETKWHKYRTSVKKVENLTGLTFFRNLPVKEKKDLEELKKEIDDVRIPN